MGIGYLTGQAGGGSNIKSIQRGTASLTATSTDITISNVDLSKAIVRITEKGTINNISVVYIKVNAELTSPTNLRLTIPTYYEPMAISWEVIEFNNVKSLQSGTASVTAGVAYTGSINSVDPSKSMIFFTLVSTAASSPLSLMLAKVYFINATSFGIESLISAKTVKWQVIEFK